jgi:hypothetical protein
MNTYGESDVLHPAVGELLLEGDAGSLETLALLVHVIDRDADVAEA